MAETKRKGVWPELTAHCAGDMRERNVASPVVAFDKHTLQPFAQASAGDAHTPRDPPHAAPVLGERSEGVEFQLATHPEIPSMSQKASHVASAQPLLPGGGGGGGVNEKTKVHAEVVTLTGLRVRPKLVSSKSR